MPLHGTWRISALVYRAPIWLETTTVPEAECLRVTQYVQLGCFRSIGLVSVLRAFGTSGTCKEATLKPVVEGGSKCGREGTGSGDTLFPELEHLNRKWFATVRAFSTSLQLVEDTGKDRR
jgi:hypothetical protein